MTVGGVTTILLDTPDVGSRVDGKNLEEVDIARCLTGILYFHNPEDRRIRVNLDCFEDICEANEFYRTVLLVATGERSMMHTELRDRDGKDAVDEGPKTYAYMNTKESAEGAIRHLITY